jgi:hypothetical protein
MRRRSEGFAVVHYRSKNRLNKPDLRIVPPRMFTIVRAGCRQIVVSCIREHCASEALLYKDPQVYPTPVYVVLRASVREARERMPSKQQADSMQDAAYGFRRTPLPRRWVNKRTGTPLGQMAHYTAFTSFLVGAMVRLGKEKRACLRVEP